MAKLRRLVAALQPAVQPRLSFRPFLLDPAAPQDGVNIHERLKSRYGAEPAAIFAPIEAQARDLGLPLNLSKQPWSYPTQSAHALIRAAAAKNSQLPLVLAILDAYFLNQAPIGDARVLARIAARHGFTEDEALKICCDRSALAVIESEAKNALSRGVRSVPTIVLASGKSISANVSAVELMEGLTAAGG